MSSYSGYIVANEVQCDVTTKQLEQTRPVTPGGPTLTLRDYAFGIKRWHEFRLRSPVPLAEEVDANEPYFDYQVYIIIGATKLVLLAPRRRIVDYVLSNILDDKIFPNFRKVNLHIEKLIAFCTEPSSEFLITSLHGRFAGANRNLKSMSLYGDDVTNSSVYSQFHHLFNFHSCGVGRRLFEGLPKLRPNEEGEIVRLSNDGFVNLNIAAQLTHAKRQAQDLIHVVNFVFNSRWVDDWVPNGQENSQ